MKIDQTNLYTDKTLVKFSMQNFEKGQMPFKQRIHLYTGIVPKLLESGIHETSSLSLGCGKAHVCDVIYEQIFIVLLGLLVDLRRT